MKVLTDNIQFMMKRNKYSENRHVFGIYTKYDDKLFYFFNFKNSQLQTDQCTQIRVLIDPWTKYTIFKIKSSNSLEKYETQFKCIYAFTTMRSRIYKQKLLIQINQASLFFLYLSDPCVKIFDSFQQIVIFYVLLEVIGEYLKFQQKYSKYFNSISRFSQLQEQLINQVLSLFLIKYLRIYSYFLQYIQTISIIIEVRMQHSHSSQLQTIKAIEYNLLSLKSRLSFLQKEQSRSNQRIEKILDSSIPIIRNKLLETQHLSKTKNIFLDIAQSRIEKGQQIKASKIEHKNEMQKNKMEITRGKVHGSLHIRQMSKKNQKIIDEAKKQWVQEKKKKSQLVKACRMESRRKIQQFHTQKQNELRKIKQQEAEELERKINEISYSFAMVVKAQAEEQKKYEKNQKTLLKLRKAVNFIHTMRPQLFEEIKQELNLTQNSNLTDDVIENILIQAEKRSKNSKPEALRLSLDETKRNINRHRPEQSSLKSIYVYGPLKKIR